MNKKKGKNPYEYINKREQKIELNPVIPYRGTSMDEVFEIRNQVDEARNIETVNKFVSSKKPLFNHIQPEYSRKQPRQEPF
jgi:hypothetical protein